MIIDDEYYYADLVFYNRILHCNVIIELKNDYSNKQKNSDKECLELLITKGGKMSENKITFKKVMNSGERIWLWELEMIN